MITQCAACGKESGKNGANCVPCAEQRAVVDRAVLGLLTDYARLEAQRAGVVELLAGPPRNGDEGARGGAVEDRERDHRAYRARISELEGEVSELDEAAAELAASLVSNPAARRLEAELHPLRARVAELEAHAGGPMCNRCESAKEALRQELWKARDADRAARADLAELRELFEAWRPPSSRSVRTFAQRVWQILTGEK